MVALKLKPFCETLLLLPKPGFLSKIDFLDARYKSTRLNISPFSPEERLCLSQGIGGGGTLPVSYVPAIVNKYSDHYCYMWSWGCKEKGCRGRCGAPP